MDLLVQVEQPDLLVKKVTMELKVKLVALVKKENKVLLDQMVELDLALHLKVMLIM